MILSESVPIWLAAGVITVGGWLFEQSSERAEIVADQGSRIAVLESVIVSTGEDIREVRAHLNNIELILLEKE